MRKQNQKLDHQRSQLELEERYIYESPDGKTIYRRKIGGTNDVTRERITPEPPKTAWEQLETYKEDLEQLVEANPAIKEALDKLLVVLALTRK